MKKVLCIVFGCGLLLGTAVRVEAGDPTAEEIVRKANRIAYYQGKDGRARVEMTVTDAQGRARQRVMSILRLDIGDDAEQKYYVYFHRPTDVKGMAYIVWKHPGLDDDRWLYLPALDLVRRIAASDKRSSFAGTNFLYEDISGRGLALDTHELAGGDDKTYEIKNTPKDKGTVEFSYYVTRINKDSFVPVMAEYYDKNGKLYRRMEAVETKEIQGYLTITKMKATDLNASSSTIAIFDNVEYDIGLEEDVFSERYLRKPPFQWIKD
ncbi:MAG: outer membrane lipoprotein-sorting protein [Candidatus Omnitrophica bacterium]|nr:outer membrane lipoprotein-sorting protein [Candidatus Omnitrophota bacterium]